eukprot:SAG22_NODE_6795_length_810_cov_1.369902_2_plen_49_part_00
MINALKRSSDKFVMFDRIVDQSKTIDELEKSNHLCIRAVCETARRSPD